MTDEKQTGARAATKEIIGLLFTHRNGTRVNLKFVMRNEKQETTESIEAIIAEHYPEDKGAGLVEACQFFMNALDTGILVRDITKDSEPDWALKMMDFMRQLQKAEAALAEYRELNK